MGESTMRLRSVTPRRVSGVNKAGVAADGAALTAAISAGPRRPGALRVGGKSWCVS